jgi:hypothetical protein
MQFNTWLNESSLNDLYDSAVEAFPNTTKRQHVVDTIKISNLRTTPFLGVKTLFSKALAQNEGREYNPIILFKKVKYYKENSNNLLEKLSLDDNVNIRCQCKDFLWRFHHFDHLDRSLYGSNRKKYQAKNNPGSANPMELPGMCKHLMAFAKSLKESGLIK